MPQDSYNSSTDDTQRYEPSALPYVPYTKSTSHSSNVQEDAQSNSLPPTLSPVSENTEYAREGEQSSLAIYAPLAPTITIVPVPEPALSKKRGPRWILLAFLLLLMIIVASSAFALSSYINRSTPQKTLDTFCSALQREDYKTAYIQLSSTMQSNFTESQFTGLFTSDKVANCRHGPVSGAGTSTTTSLQLVHHVSGETNNDRVTLTKDGQGQWKIDDLQTV